MVRPGNRPATVRYVLVKVLVAAVVVLFPLPALVLGARGLVKRPGYSPDEPADRASYILVVGLRALVLLLVFALSAVVLISSVGAAITASPSRERAST